MDGTEAPAPRRRPPVRSALQRFWRLLLIAVLLGAAAGYQVSELQQVRFETSAEVLLSDPRESGVFRELAPADDVDRFVQNQAQLFRSSSVVTRASELLGGAIAPADIRERVTTETSQEVDLVTVRTWASTGEGAAQLADALIAAYEEVVRENLQENAAASAAELEEAAADLQARIAQAEAGLAAAPNSASLASERDALVAQLVTIRGLQERLSIDTALYGSGVETVDPAAVPEEPVSPRPITNAVIGAVLALLAAGWFAVWRSGATQRVEDRHDPAAVLQAPFLGDVPELPSKSLDQDVLGLSALQAPGAESYRFIATALDYVLDGRGASTIMVTSPHPGDGKTTTALNVGIALRGEGHRLALLDVDGRVAGLTRRTGLEGRAGLTDAARHGNVAAGVHALQTADRRTVDVTPIGTEPFDPGLYFRTPSYRHLLAQLRADHDIVLIDAPPLLAVAETSAAAGAVDGIVLVVRRGTPMKALEDVRDRLQFIGAPLLGYVFNRAKLRTSPYGAYGYGRSVYGDDSAATGAQPGAAPSDPLLGSHRAGAGQRLASGKPSRSR